MEQRGKSFIRLNPSLVTVYTEYGYGEVNYTKFKDVLDFPSTFPVPETDEKLSQDESEKQIQKIRDDMLNSIVEVRLKKGGVAYVKVRDLR
jgi:hypothetical protein